jgi:drug/metabolite transporter (DMT)-like permease
MASPGALITAFSIAVAGQVLYHVAQKQVASMAHPIVSVLAMYAVAFVSCLPLIWFFPLQASVGETLSALNWPVLLAGLAIVGIEVGFLLTYRLGAPLASTAVASSALVAFSLFAVGTLLFHEPVTWPRAAGALLCLVGVGLITRG